MNYLDFELQVRALSGPRCRVTVRSPRGDHEGEADLPATPEALRAERARLHGEALRSASRGGGAGDTDASRRGAGEGRAGRDVRPAGTLGDEAGALGRALHGAIFQGRVAELFAATCAEASLLGRGVRLKLVTPDAALALIPWELLCPHRGDSLCLSEATPLVRYVLVGKPPAPLLVEPPLRVLGVLSEGGGGPLDLARERACVSAELAGLCARGLAEIEWLEAPTGQDLRAALDRKEWHVLHFAGHGSFDRDSAQGMLSIAAGGRGHLRASDLRLLLRDRPSLRLVFLNSCEGAVGDAHELFSSTAALVAEAGVPAVVAMQFPISDEAAARFARCVYHQIAAGAALEKAVAEARKDVYMGGSLEWATPVLFTRSAEGALFRARAPGLGARPAATGAGPDAASAAGGARPTAAAKWRLSPFSWKTKLACLSAAGLLATQVFGGDRPDRRAPLVDAIWDSVLPAPAGRPVLTLRWGGTECEGKPAEVALGACHDRRSLGWLAAELQALIAGGKVKLAPGHEPLGGATFKLVTNSLSPKEGERNKYIFVCEREASYGACVASDYYLTIGWHGDAAPLDGAIRVYKRSGKLVLGPLYYGAGGGWYADREGASRL